MRVSMDRNKLHKHSHLFSMIFLHCKNMKTSRAERVVVKSVLLFFCALCIFIFSFLRIKSEHDEEEMTLSSFQENILHYRGTSQEAGQITN